MWECSDHQIGTPQKREVLFILVGMGQNLKPKFKDTAAVQRKGGRLVPSVFLAAHLNFATSLLHCIFRLALLPFSETLTLLWFFVILETCFFPCQSFLFLFLSLLSWGDVLKANIPLCCTAAQTAGYLPRARWWQTDFPNFVASFPTFRQF